jgi:hypothetical protein
MPEWRVDLDERTVVVESLNSGTTLGEFLDVVRDLFDISENDFYKYRLLAWRGRPDRIGAPDIKNLVDPSKSLNYVGKEFGIPWGSTLILEKTLP